MQVMPRASCCTAGEIRKKIRCEVDRFEMSDICTSTPGWMMLGGVNETPRTSCHHQVNFPGDGTWKSSRLGKPTRLGEAGRLCLWLCGSGDLSRTAAPHSVVMLSGTVPLLRCSCCLVSTASTPRHLVTNSGFETLACIHPPAFPEVRPTKAILMQL